MKNNTPDFTSVKMMLLLLTLVVVLKFSGGG